MNRTINLIARDNGLGLTRDARLLAAALEVCGCSVTCTRLDEADERARWHDGHGARVVLAHLRHAGARMRGAARHDVNIHFEHLWPRQLPRARCNIALPNPEWFDANDLRHLGRIDRVWAKTHHAEALFRGRGNAVQWIGFASEDAALPDAPRERAFFHLAGGSRTKGTTELLALWLRHPEWPRLTVVRHGAAYASLPRAANLRIVADYLDHAALRALQNAHAFHLCPSTTEGYGHYLCEAMSVGAVAVTTDAAPMNELIDAQRGVLVAARAAGRQGLATLYAVDPAAMERAIEACLAMDDAQRAAIGARARAWFVDNQRQFPQRIAAALDALPDQS